MQATLEKFINSLKGDVISILPNVKPTFMGMGTTARIDHLLVVGKKAYRSSSIFRVITILPPAFNWL